MMDAVRFTRIRLKSLRQSTPDDHDAVAVGGDVIPICSVLVTSWIRRKCAPTPMLEVVAAPCRLLPLKHAGGRWKQPARDVISFFDGQGKYDVALAPFLIYRHLLRDR